MTFAGEFGVSILDDLVSPGDALVSDFQLVGTDAIMDASFGMWVDYPRGEPDVMRITRRTGEVETVGGDGRWIPDAFQGPITELFDAIEEDRSPTVDGVDHLRTLRVVEAAYESASRNSPVELGI
jgi:predicted dehydrogenase